VRAEDKQFFDTKEWSNPAVTFSSSGYYGYWHTKIFTQEFQTDVSYSDEKDQGNYRECK